MLRSSGREDCVPTSFYGATILDTRSLMCYFFYSVDKKESLGRGLRLHVNRDVVFAFFSLPPAYLLASKTKEFLNFLFCVSTRYSKCCISPDFLLFHIRQKILLFDSVLQTSSGFSRFCIICNCNLFGLNLYSKWESVSNLLELIPLNL